MDGTGRIIAKEGYAVAGAEIQVGKFIDGIRLVYQRLREDGTLDAKVSYKSEWIGYPSKAAPQTLTGGGQRIIGIHVHQGAILNAIALVVADDANK